jgi:glucokinase
VGRFVQLDGAQTGTVPLTAMALGGVYIGGGIVTPGERRRQLAAERC